MSFYCSAPQCSHCLPSSHPSYLASLLLPQVVFTKSATGALKLVGETFPWGKDSTFRYLRENHNSVLGIRE